MARCFSDTQPEGCRNDPARWRAWNKKVQRWAEGGRPSREEMGHGGGGGMRHVIAANNLYDARYIRHFSGVAAHPVPNYCDKGQSYGPGRPEVLLSMAQHVEIALLPALEQAVRARRLERDVSFAHIRRLYPRYRYVDLARHPCIVLVPYQVSVMSFFEQYRLNIPLLVPSRRLLASLAVNSGVLQERTWASVFGQRSKASALEAHPLYVNESDPNNDGSEEAVYDWLQYADYYTFPHVLYWDSLEDLVDLAAGRVVDLALVSHRMRMFNLEQGREIRREWKALLQGALSP